MNSRKQDISPTTPFKNALEKTTRALADDSELKLSVSGSSTELDGHTVKIPQIARKMTKDEVMLARGNADALALKKRFHNRLLHDHYLPTGQLAKQLYQNLETARCEIIGAQVLPGTATNLDAKITEDIKITPVEHADEVLKIALTKELKRVEWVEVEKISKSDDKSQASIQ